MSSGCVWSCAYCMPCATRNGTGENGPACSIGRGLRAAASRRGTSLVVVVNDPDRVGLGWCKERTSRAPSHARYAAAYAPVVLNDKAIVLVPS